MSELQNKTVTMELNNLQLETIKYLFGHNDWEMKIIEQSAVVEENGGNSHVQNNTDQSTQTNNDNVANETDEDDNPEFVIPPDISEEECDFPSKSVKHNKTQQTMCIPLSLLCKLFPHVSHVGKPTRIGKAMANKCYETFWHYVPLVPVKELCSVVSCQSICLH
jgi:hypothetical protein